MFDHIVPCGIADTRSPRLPPRASRSIDGLDVDRRSARSGKRGDCDLLAERRDVGRRSSGRERRTSRVARRSGRARRPPTGRRPTRRLACGAGVDSDGGGRASRQPRKPDVAPRRGEDGRRLPRHCDSTMRRLDLVTVCEEAGCPNIYECWADGTATLHDQRGALHAGVRLLPRRHPPPPRPRPEEPERVADGRRVDAALAHAVVTAVARDDLADGGAARLRRHDRAPSGARARATPSRSSSPTARATARLAQTIFDARPERPQPQPRDGASPPAGGPPSASYARSLAVLARAKAAGLATKSGLILGMGETRRGRSARSATSPAVGVDIVTIGQYLRPSASHLPVARFWTPEEFERSAASGARRWASPTSRPRRSPARATTPARPSTARSRRVRERVSRARRRPTLGSPAPDGSPGCATQMARAGVERAAAVARCRPALAQRLRGDAPRAADGARPSVERRTRRSSCRH